MIFVAALIAAPVVALMQPDPVSGDAPAANAMPEHLPRPDTTTNTLVAAAAPGLTR
jgi:hypothetical protein